MKGFKEFIFKSSLIDFAVGVIIGAAFGQIINSLVQDIIMPPINLFLAQVNFANWLIVLKVGSISGPYQTLADAVKAGAITLNLGSFINAFANFIIIAICIYLIVLLVAKIKATLTNKEKEVNKTTTKECKYCFSIINIKATKCPNCTTDLDIKNN